MWLKNKFCTSDEVGARSYKYTGISNAPFLFVCRHRSLPSPLPSLSFHIPYSLPYLILLLLCPLPFPLSYSFLLRLLEKNFMPSLCQNYTLCNKVDVAQWQSAGLSISRSVVLIQVGRYFFSFSFASCDIKNTIIIFLMYKKITSSHLL